MKYLKTLSATIALLLIAQTLAVGNIANAQNNLLKGSVGTEIKTRMEVRKQEMLGNKEAIQARIQEHKTTMLENRAELKVRLGAEAKTRIGNGTDNIFMRLDSSIAKLTAMDSRIEGKIQEFKDRGVDVSASIDLLGKAQASLEITKTDITEAKAKIKEELAKETVSRENIVSILLSAKDSVKKTHEAYVDVIVSLRAGLQIETEQE